MTIEVSRRQLMASAGGMVLASFALPSSLRKILDGAAPAARSSARLTSAPISEIQHVVVLMQENRSFDHYFGTMPGVRGFADPDVPKSRFYQYDAENPDKYLLPFHTDTHSTSAQNVPSNSHSWGPQHDSHDNGKMDGFVTARHRQGHRHHRSRPDALGAGRLAGRQDPLRGRCRLQRGLGDRHQLRHGDQRDPAHRRS